MGYWAQACVPTDANAAVSRCSCRSTCAAVNTAEQGDFFVEAFASAIVRRVVHATPPDGPAVACSTAEARNDGAARRAAAPRCVSQRVIYAPL